MKVLVVEDEVKIANSIKAGLEGEKFVVDLSLTGLEAYDLASVEEYDIILLDWLLPGMSGYELCRKLRQVNISTPILMLTAKGQVNDKVDALNAGADDYLTKPFDFSELIARMKALVRRPKNVLPKVLKYAGLEIDTDAFIVKRNGQSINLSAKEFSLLQLLMQNHGRVLTKELIINKLWDFDADVLPNTVEVFIKHLREKVDKPFPGKSLIQTVRGFGYTLKEE